jgi:hypothetical protein
VAAGDAAALPLGVLEELPLGVLDGLSLGVLEELSLGVLEELSLGVLDALLSVLGGAWVPEPSAPPPPLVFGEGVVVGVGVAGTEGVGVA